MAWRTLSAVVLTGALFAAAPGSPQKEPGDSPLVGKYEIVSGESDGKPEAAEKVKGHTVVITRDTIAVADKDSKKLYAASYKLDTSKTPWHITMKSTQAPVVGQVSHGLVEKSGDTLKLIYGTNEKDQPTSFKTRKGENLFVLKKTGK